ncbi:MAG: hypothetical protein JW883_12600 [Deltaproteobacteria bacterium]|nr:hypothetical protein [Deltaproteobacteria bacterium]
MKTELKDHLPWRQADKTFLMIMVGLVMICVLPQRLGAQYAVHNRPKPLMDYVPQEIGVYDTMYWELDESDCRGCHGNSLADRHHLTQLVLEDGLCTPCHEVTPEPPYVAVTRDCMTSGCHSWDDLQINGWHHNTDLSDSGNCVACHDPNLVDARSPENASAYPPSIITPTPFSCENCHWLQDRVPGTGPDDSGHPSTYEHYGSSGGFSEYSNPIYGNFETHHMGFQGNVYAGCYQCHSQDPGYPYWDPYDLELIRYCEACHSADSLHSIGPHVRDTDGWEAAGFHVPSTNTQTRDVDPVVYRTRDATSPYAPEATPGFTENQMCAGCHGDRLPDSNPQIPQSKPALQDMSPIAGICDTIVTMSGAYFGPERTSERSVKIRPVSGGEWVDVPIYSWTENRIEWKLRCWTFPPGNYYVAVMTEAGNSSPFKVFSLRDYPTLLSVSPASGPCREILTLSGSGGFENRRELMASDGYTGLTHVVDFVASCGTYTATKYSGPRQWADTQFQVMFGDVYEDRKDANTGQRNFIQDLDEPLIRRCEDLCLGVYSVYVKSICFGDEDSSGDFSAGDTVCQVVSSDPVYFELTSKSVLYKLSPESIERSYYCGTHLVNNILTIYGQNFGPSQQAGDVVRIGTSGQYAVDPLTKGIILPRVRWDSMNLKVGVDKPHVPDGAVGRDDIVVWVVKDGKATNALTIQILHDTCP